MLNKEKHQLIMSRILMDIYSDTAIAPLLGFKGGTCAYLFYGLTRFSVDLDFDLLKIDEQTKKLVFERMKMILEKYGQIKNQRVKRFMIFFWLSYGPADHNIKIEISIYNLIHNIAQYYYLQEYLGIAVLVPKRDAMFAGKLTALTTRKTTVMRDIYDVHFFLKNNWDINDGIIKMLTSKQTKDYLSDCILTVEKINDNEIMTGLGELVEEKEKNWIKKDLRKDTIFLLKNYMAAMKS